MGRRAIVLLVALVLAGLAAWAVWNFMQNVREDATAGQEQVTVFRAGLGGIAEGTEGDILISDFNSNGTLISEGVDQLEDTPPDAIQSEDELRTILTTFKRKGLVTFDQTHSIQVSVDVLIRPTITEVVDSSFLARIEVWAGQPARPGAAGADDGDEIADEDSDAEPEAPPS